jgi:hypothetical protein
MIQAWQRVQDWLRTRNAYRDVFSDDAGRRVLRDLGRICDPTRSNFDPDPRQHAYNEGKRAIWLRIQNMLNLSEEQIYQTLKENDGE